MYHITRITMMMMIKLSIQRQGIVNSTQGLSQFRHSGTGVTGTEVRVVAGWTGVPGTV
jgi:hypothetical protein